MGRLGSMDGFCGVVLLLGGSSSVVPSRDELLRFSCGRVGVLGVVETS